MEWFIGQIILFGGNFAIRNFTLANGQLLAISQNQALFSLYGTTYGGDGRTTFGLPDFRGRAPMSSGNGPGLSPRPLGQKTGSEYLYLNANQLASHNHAAVFASHPIVSIPVHTTSGNQDDTNPGAGILTNNSGLEAYTSEAANGVYGGAAISTQGGAIQVGNTGSSQPIYVLQPFQVINYEVALQGVYPSRN